MDVRDIGFFNLISHSGYILKFDTIVIGTVEHLQCEVIGLDGSGADNSAANQSVNVSNENSYSLTKIEIVCSKLDNCKSSNILRIQVCKDRLTGLELPVLLMQHGKIQSCSRFCYTCLLFLNCANLESKQVGSINGSSPYFVTLCEFELDYNLSEFAPKDFHILDGPSLIWLDKKMGLLFHFPCDIQGRATGAFDYVTRSQICERTSQSNKVSINILWAGAAKRREQYVVIGTKNCSCTKSNVAAAHDGNAKESCENMEIFVISIQRENDSYKHINLLSSDAATILPHQYCSILTALFVEDILLDVTHVETRGCREQYKMSSCSSCLFASTSQKHLLEFRGGKLCRCVDIQSPSISTLNLVDSRGVEAHLGLWSRDDGHFTGIYCHDLQVKFEKRDVGHFFVDDFTGFGSEQALLLTGAQDTWPPISWTLTDFGPTHVESSNMVPDASDHADCNSSIQTAVVALQMRLQNDLIRLRDLEKEFTDRRCMIKTVCTAVRRLTLDQAPPTLDQTELVHLCGNETLGSQMTSPDVHSTDEDCDWLEVRDTWQRMYDGQWVVGVDVVNVSQCKLSNLSLGACLPSHIGLMKEHQTSKSFWPIRRECHMDMPAENSSTGDDWIFNPSAAKKHRLEQHSLVEEKYEWRHLTAGHQTTVVCVISQPLFGVDDRDDLLLFLSFDVARQLSEPVGSSTTTAELSSGPTKLDQFTVYCGRVSFSIQDMFGSRHCINLRDPSADMSDCDRQRCLFAMDSCQLKVPLVILSTRTRIDNIIGAFTASGFTHCPQFNCYLCPPSIDNFKAVRIQVLTTVAKDISINLHCRDKAQLWSVLHYLYHVLPDDVVMVTKYQSEANQLRLVQDCRKALHNELDYSITSLEELLAKQNQHATADEVEQMETDDRTNKSDQTIQTMRDNFAQSKGRMELHRKDRLIPASGYMEIQKDLQEKQQISDNAVIQLTSTTL